MSGPEKRYFKVANKKDAESKYLKLFEAIESHQEFDEEAYTKYIYGSEPVQGKKYSELKAYLYDQLVRSLQQYDEQTSVDYRLKGQLLSVRTLYRRSLFDDCRYLLRRAKKLAEKYERFSLLLEIIDWEMRIAYAKADIDYFDTHLASLQEQQENCVQQIANIKSYQRLFYELYVLARKNTIRGEERKRKVAELAAHPLLDEVSRAQSFGAQVLYFRTHSLLSYFHKQTEEFYDYSYQLLALLESKPALLREDVSQYIAALSNFVVSCGFLQRYEEVRTSLAKLRKIRPNTIDDELKIHRQYYNNYFSLCITTGAFDEGLRVLNKHLEEVDKLDRRLFERSSFYFQYFYIYFGAEEFEQALEHLNNWLNLPRSVEQQDLQTLARLLNLTLHYEMGNHLLLDSLIRSTQRYLQKKKRLHRFEQLLLNCLRQANRTQDRKDRLALFQKAHQELQQLHPNVQERAILRFFDFNSWLQSKATGQSFATIVQERDTNPTRG